MSSNDRIAAYDDAHALILGLGLLSTGGGGWPRRGFDYLLALLGGGFEIKWTNIQEVPTADIVCSVFGMGSTAPHASMSADEMRESGFGAERYPRPGIRALEELGKYLGTPIRAVVPFELGGFNTVVAIDAAVRAGLILIDGDCCGRSVPEMSQALPAAVGKPAWPLTICDQWGNSMVLKDCPSTRVAERIGKMVSIVSKTPTVYGTCAHAGFAMPAGTLAPMLVSGSLSSALAIGRAVLEARAAGRDPVVAAADAMEGWVLFRGVVSERHWEDPGGYQVGTTNILGEGEFSGVARVWYRNENHVLWHGEDVVATSPDLITVCDGIDASARTNAELCVGERVAVIGCAAVPEYRTGMPLALMEPRHYGFEIEYRPIEQLIDARAQARGE